MNSLKKVLSGGGSCATGKKGLKARKMIAQGKASLRATPWVIVTQDSLPLLLERGEGWGEESNSQDSASPYISPPDKSTIE